MVILTHEFLQHGMQLSLWISLLPDPRIYYARASKYLFFKKRLEEANCFLGAQMILEQRLSQNISHRFQLLDPFSHLNQLLLGKRAPPSRKLDIPCVAVQYQPHLRHRKPRFLGNFDKDQLLEDLSRVASFGIDQPGRWKHIHAFVVT